MPVTYDEIAALAYQFWKERGEPFGSPEVDWDRAETTLQVRPVTLTKTAVSESEPQNLEAGGAGDELLAEKTASIAEDEFAASSPEPSGTSPSRAKGMRRKNSPAKPSGSDTHASGRVAPTPRANWPSADD